MELSAIYYSVFAAYNNKKYVSCNIIAIVLDTIFFVLKITGILFEKGHLHMSLKKWKASLEKIKCPYKVACL